MNGIRSAARIMYGSSIAMIAAFSPMGFWKLFFLLILMSFGAVLGWRDDEQGGNHA